MRVVLDTNIVLSALLFRKGHLAWLRTAWVNYCLKHATYCQPVNESIKERAQQLSQLSIQGMDAFHLACAETMKCDYFLTVDDRLIKRYKGSLQVKNPVELILLLETNNDDR